MSLPAGQQRILDGIAGTLQARDPRLASLFSIFTRLNRHEPMPRAEELVISGSRLRRAVRGLGGAFAAAGRLRPVVIIPVLLAAVAGLLILAPLAGSQRACGPGAQAAAAARPAGHVGVPWGRAGICEIERTAGAAGR